MDVRSLHFFFSGLKRAARSLPFLSVSACSLVGYDAIDGGHLFLHGEDSGAPSVPDSSTALDGGSSSDTGVYAAEDAELRDVRSFADDTSVPVDADIADSGSTDAVDGGPTTDAAFPTEADASMPAADAGTNAGDAAQLVGPDAGDPDASTSTCSGTAAIGLCWYLGALGATCDQTCATHGGYDTRATSAVGSPSQGGSYANCHTVLVALGYTRLPASAYRVDGQGLGCHVWVTGDTYWLDDRGPVFSASAFHRNANIACGCAR